MSCACSGRRRAAVRFRFVFQAFAVLCSVLCPSPHAHAHTHARPHPALSAMIAGAVTDDGLFSVHNYETLADAIPILREQLSS